MRIDQNNEGVAECHGGDDDDQAEGLASCQQVCPVVLKQEA